MIAIAKMSISRMSFSAISGKLKVASIASLSVVTLTAATISVTANRSKETSEGFQNIGAKIQGFGEAVKNSFDKAIPALSNEYSTQKENLVKKFKGSGASLSKEYKENSELIGGAYKNIKENKSEINYYVVALGNLIKPLLTNIKTIIRDSIVHNEDTKKHQQLLSVQKIIAVASKPKFKQFSGAIKELVESKISTIEKMTLEDGQGIIKIFREVREDDFDIFMDKVMENIKKVKENKKTYSTANELLKDVFIGEEYKKLNEKRKNLDNVIGDGKGAITELEIKVIKEILKKLEEKCKASTSKKE